MILRVYAALITFLIGFPAGYAAAERGWNLIGTFVVSLVLSAIIIMMGATLLGDLNHLDKE